MLTAHTHACSLVHDNHGTLKEASSVERDLVVVLEHVGKLVVQLLLLPLPPHHLLGLGLGSGGLGSWRVRVRVRVRVRGLTQCENDKGVALASQEARA